MTASKDIARPGNQHRLSLASSVPNRQSISRAHSSSLGATNGVHRINRRKSSSFAPGANTAALEAAVEHAVAEPSSSSTFHRRSSISKAALASLNDGLRPSMPSTTQHRSSDGFALTDGPTLASFAALGLSTKTHPRRASEASRVSKKDKLEAGGDLKCEQCGKAYKHGSCLSKHLWEHTPQWQYTSKLLISKHQQVQLLEAASVLVAMNADGTPANDSDSSSPAASGSSDVHDGDLSSTETTPPPQGYRDDKRHSNSSSVYSRSYQSIFSSGSAPQDSTFSHARHWSTSSNRPPTANTSIAESYPDEDPADLAAAVGLLSCSYGTPKTGPTVLADVPPVPPLPAKYLDNTTTTRKTLNHRQHRDVDMEEDSMSDEDRIIRQDDAGEYGVFGNMDA